jgi:hypothetical protein
MNNQGVARMSSKRRFSGVGVNKETKSPLTLASLADRIDKLEVKIAEDMTVVDLINRVDYLCEQMEAMQDRPEPDSHKKDKAQQPTKDKLIIMCLANNGSNNVLYLSSCRDGVACWTTDIDSAEVHDDFEYAQYVCDATYEEFPQVPEGYFTPKVVHKHIMARQELQEEKRGSMWRYVEEPPPKKPKKPKNR